MKRSLVAALIVIAGCSGGPSSEEARTAFYDQLYFMLTQYNDSLDRREYNRQATVELELERITTPRFTWLAEDAVKSADIDRRNLAVWGLAFARNGDAAPILEQALGDPHPIVRGSAAFAIGRVAPPNPPMAKIVPLLDDYRPEVRKSGLIGLRQLARPRDPRVPADRVVALLEDPDADVRNEAALLLGRLLVKETVPALARRGLSDSHFLVRLNSALSLSSFGAEGLEAVPLLIDALKDSETTVVESAWWALKRITGLDFDKSHHAWRDWFEEDQKKFEYVCPDHNQVVRDAPGTCPECGRRLERQPRPIRPGLDVWGCAEHPDEKGTRGGKCPQCGKPLTPKR